MATVVFVKEYDESTASTDLPVAGSCQENDVLVRYIVGYLSSVDSFPRWIRGWRKQGEKYLIYASAEAFLTYEHKGRMTCCRGGDVGLSGALHPNVCIRSSQPLAINEVKPIIEQWYRENFTFGTIPQTRYIDLA